MQAVAAGRAGEGVGRSNPPADGAAQAAQQGYEIVYGHRRHRACLDLGLPVLAVVEEVGEQQLFEQMERENRARADLSAWEQGMMYARALDQGLYPSNRQLAQAIGRDLGDVGKALSLAAQVVVRVVGGQVLADQGQGVGGRRHRQVSWWDVAAAAADARSAAVVDKVAQATRPHRGGRAYSAAPPRNR